MSSNEISGSEMLMRQISQLKAERTSSEEVFNQSFNELTRLIFNFPAKSVKEELSIKRNNKRDLLNLSKIVMNRSTDYIIEQSFGKRQKLGVFVTSIIIELVSNPLINRNIVKFFSVIHKKLFGETEDID